MFLWGYLQWEYCHSLKVVTKCALFSSIDRYVVYAQVEMAIYKWGVSRKLATFGKMTVTGVYLRYLNVLLLYYPFMSNPRPCLGCETQQMWSTVLHFFLVAGFVSRT